MRRKQYLKPSVTPVVLHTQGSILAFSPGLGEGGDASEHGNPPLDTREFAWDNEEEWD